MTTNIAQLMVIVLIGDVVKISLLNIGTFSRCFTKNKYYKQSKFIIPIYDMVSASAILLCGIFNLTILSRILEYSIITVSVTIL